MSTPLQDGETPPQGSEHEGSPLSRAVHHAGHVLPAQAPIGTFVHHNTLHAYQRMPFHQAVLAASAVLETEPYLKEAQYREAFARGRIRPADLVRALQRFEHERGAPAGTTAIAGIARARVEQAALLHEIEGKTAAELDWAIAEEGALDALRSDVPAATRASLVADATSFLRRSAPPELLAELFDSSGRGFATLERELQREPESVAARTMFAICKRRLRGVRARAEARPHARYRSHRDLLLERTGSDPAALINPVMIRLCASFLDLGMAQWPMPGRERGFYRAFVENTHTLHGPQPEWTRGLTERVRAFAREGLTALEVVGRVLDELGVPESEHAQYLERVALELPGWAGMFNRLEHDSVLAPQLPYPASLADYFAVRLCHEVLALAHVAREELGFSAPLVALREQLQALPASAEQVWAPAPESDAYRLYQLAQLVGLGAPALWTMSQAECAELLGWLDDFSELSRRRVWHDAYEHHHLDEVVSALAQNARLRARKPRSKQAEHQILFCIDDREESFRRAIEELSPSSETFGIAGFFGMAIEWCGLDDPTPAALCPVVVTPAHRVVEVPEDEHAAPAALRKQRRAQLALLLTGFSRGSRSFVRASLITPLIGLLSAAPLVLRVFFPRTAERLLRGLLNALFPAPITRLTGLRDASEPTASEPLAVGFTLAEKADRVEGALRNIGLTHDFAPIVLVLGHGSVSVNNPHMSAYDCGACGGKHGGPNARLFAESANRPEVRAILKERGLVIPDDTLFIGGEHNTGNDDVELFDLHRVPASHAERVPALVRMLDRARELSAHERCRRFESAPLDLTPEEALRHVQARTADLSQARPELGHATNAVAVVGRRELTSGLFLDRRAFLISYDPAQDATGGILERILAAVGPVGAGINLEYYFSHVDSDRYGCGTKLPHNVTGLLGVMDGHASDLRTGLPWQMVEIHEPVRLLLVVESTPEVLLQIASRNAEIAELVTGEWIRLVSIDPRTRALHVFEGARGFVPYDPSDLPVPRVHSSREWYGARRDFLAPAIIEPHARSERSLVHV